MDLTAASHKAVGQDLEARPTDAVCLRAGTFFRVIPGEINARAALEFDIPTQSENAFVWLPCQLFLLDYNVETKASSGTCKAHTGERGHVPSELLVRRGVRL